MKKARKCQYCGSSQHMTRIIQGVVHGPRYYACFECQPSMSSDEYGEFSRQAVGSDMGDLTYCDWNTGDDSIEIKEGDSKIVELEEMEELDIA